ncbi:ABC transporter permease [Streptomyces sp. NPDC044984]|uniref:ABC transporter permease n=1 Tax=Streptomyces sp. NPDC044984 TaxID=3154335 RepID=UPI0033C4079C
MTRSPSPSPGRAAAAGPTARLSVRDLLGEALAGVLQRPVRTMLTMVGVVLGVGTVVAVLGMTASASGQISERFTALTATEVTVRPSAGAQDAAGSPDGSPFPADADARAARIEGVRSAGTYYALASARVGDITGVPLPGASAQRLPVIAASAGTLPALRATLQGGRLFDSVLDDRAEPVAVLGSGAARRLGVSRLDRRPVIFIGGTPFTVIGIVGDVERKAEVLSSVIVPRGTAHRMWGPPGKRDQPARMIVDTELGAAADVAGQLPLALRPDRPDVLQAVAPPDPRTLRNDVSTDLDSLFLLLSGVSLAIGTVGIANTTLIAVLERTGEIGLRRALGARRRHVVAQFLTESALIGGVGGLVGAAAGVVAVVAVAVVQRWTPVLPLTVAVLAPVIGLATGLVAGAYPALRAARIEPVDAFRH